MTFEFDGGELDLDQQPGRGRLQRLGQGAGVEVVQRTVAALRRGRDRRQGDEDPARGQFQVRHLVQQAAPVRL